jgi:hypothetical protein
MLLLKAMIFVRDGVFSSAGGPVARREIAVSDVVAGWC